MNCNYENLLREFLNCGSLDLSVLEGIEYDLCEIVEELRANGINPTLNAITAEVFYKGQLELEEAVDAAITDRKNAQEETDISHEGIAEYYRLQGEIEELETLNPDRDMRWYCNCLDTSCWLEWNESIYRKYLADEIRNIEDRMGFEF